jgi:hypothetical protein
LAKESLDAVNLGGFALPHEAGCAAVQPAQRPVPENRTHREDASFVRSRKGLSPAADNCHGFDVVGHTEAAEIGHALTWRKCELRAFVILVFVCLHGSAGTDDDAFDFVTQILSLKIIQDRNIFGIFEFHMGIIGIIVIVFKDLEPILSMTCTSRSAT